MDRVKKRESLDHGNILSQVNYFFEKIIIVSIIVFSVIFIFLSIISINSERCSNFLSHFCHQIPDRCFEINDSYIGVCSRCLGIYIGITLVGVWVLLKKNYKRLFFTSFLLSIITIYLKLDGYNINNFCRGISGLFIGSFVVISLSLLIRKLQEYFIRILKVINNTS